MFLLVFMAGCWRFVIQDNLCVFCFVNSPKDRRLFLDYLCSAVILFKLIISSVCSLLFFYSCVCLLRLFFIVYFVCVCSLFLFTPSVFFVLVYFVCVCSLFLKENSSYCVVNFGPVWIYQGTNGFAPSGAGRHSSMRLQLLFLVTVLVALNCEDHFH